MIQLPQRQIHLDFHTPAWAQGVGADFDPDAFADTLAAAHVTSVTCFARCHHGLCYYPTKTHPELIHPNLAVPDLLGEQIKACHARGIRVPAYTTVQWDQRQATDHPEWVMIDAEGAPVGGRGSLEPGFYAFLDVFHPGYRAFLEKHVADLLECRPEIDGLFFDIVQPRASLAPHWRSAMVDAGLDPADEHALKRFAVKVHDDWKREMSAFCRSLPQWDDDKTIFYNAGHVGPADAATDDATTHHEIESLPGGQWGYGHFPVAHAYTRTTDKPSLAMTGRFHTSWGDFHSYRRPAALEYECLRSAAEGAAAVSVGDQLHPSGKIDTATYDLVGGAFAKLKAAQDAIGTARRVREIALLTPESFAGESGTGAMGGKAGEADSGAVALLASLRRQVDRVTP
ncbi:MAG: beta-galactosidase, partial [Planctomycetota bacterium]